MYNMVYQKKIFSDYWLYEYLSSYVNTVDKKSHISINSIKGYIKLLIVVKNGRLKGAQKIKAFAFRFVKHTVIYII